MSGWEFVDRFLWSFVRWGSVACVLLILTA